MWLRLLGLLAATMLAGACNSQDRPTSNPVTSDVPHSAAPALENDSTLPYTDNELALARVVENYRPVDIIFARYRTDEEKWVAEKEITDRVFATSGHERERLIFEERLFAAMVAANDTLLEDIGRYQGVLHDALYEAMDECAAEEGWPGVRLYDVSQELGEQYERDFGLTLDMFLDLRHECSKYAVTYPTLDPEYRDELLARRREHFMQAVRDWMAENPQLVVPVEHYEGDNHPHEDLLVQVCLEFDDPEACAREERVTLP